MYGEAVSYTGRVGLRFVFSLFALAVLSNSQTASKKPVTIDDVLSQHRPQSISPIWAPDSASFAYQEKGAMELYKVAGGKAKEWFKPSKLEQDAVKPAESSEFGWQNRRVSSEAYQWFPNSKDLLVAIGGDLFIVRPNGKHEQLTKTEIDEEDPELSPDGTQILYR